MRAAITGLVLRPASSVIEMQLDRGSV